jgi:lysylphosphatidylglycerol synthetase-like protein (DUF2156 family)
MVLMNLDSKWRINLWQLAFLLLSTSWLLAPHLNHFLSYRTGLISQFELPSQPYSLIFRLCDILAAGLLILVAWRYKNSHSKRTASLLLGLVGLGMLADPIFTTTCHLTNGVCIEYVSLPFFLHALETIATSLGIFVLGFYDAVMRKRLVSTAFVVLQILYAVLFISQLASHNRFNTLSQFAYQLGLIIWLAWFIRDFIVASPQSKRIDKLQTIKRLAAGWAFLNGLLSILLSLADIHVVGKLKGLYFVGDSAWLAQHGMVVGVVLIYLSRHLLRGERRARHLFMGVALLETLKYSVITPHPGLMLLYFGTFCALFILKDAFDRGPASTTWRLRLKEVVFLAASLTLAALIALLILYSNTHSTEIANRSADHFFDYTLRAKLTPDSRLESALLAHAFSAFLLSAIILVLWILFKPQKSDQKTSEEARSLAEAMLHKYSSSTEDFFKMWPNDKLYFWHHNAFIAYKVSGPVAFALADPVGRTSTQSRALVEFIKFCRGRSLRVCFLPIYEHSEVMYKNAGLTTMQIGASALVNTGNFIDETMKDKWWRWQKNRATKGGYQYAFAHFPHSDDLLDDLEAVSDSWLSKEGRRERCFALGYFDRGYLNQCDIHYLRGDSGKIVAFANQLPTFKKGETASVDLLRHRSDADNTMPYLLLNTIRKMNSEGYKWLDLGFVPFAETNDPAIKLIRVLSVGKFSAKGLEQFKNKFDPLWEPNFIAYDGDLADLALVTLNIERVMSREDTSRD